MSLTKRMSHVLGTMTVLSPGHSLCGAPRFLFCGLSLLGAACGGRSLSPDDQEGGELSGTTSGSGGASAITTTGTGNASSTLAAAGGTSAAIASGGTTVIVASGGTGTVASGGTPATAWCAQVICPALPTACTKIAQDPNACCPECLESTCPPCADVNCAAGTHPEIPDGSCCSECFADPLDACGQGQRDYPRQRAQMLDKYASVGCVNSSECVIVAEHNSCVWSCGYALPSTTAANLESNLTNVAESYCASCPAPDPVFCEVMAPACVNGRCVAVDP